MSFLLRRSLHSAFLLFGVSLLAFLFLAMAPGNYVDEMRLNPQISPATASALRATYGINDPLPARYLHWLRSVARGELGYSFSYNSPALPLLWARAQNTLLLTVTATLLAWLLAVPLGVWGAARPGRYADRLITVNTSLLMAVPDLLVALAFLLLAARTGWFPTGGMASVGMEGASPAKRLFDLWVHMMPPVVVLLLATLPTLIRHVRAAMVETLDSAFIRTARASGIPRQRVLFRYALRAAANPLISLFGFSIGALLSSSLLVEVVWGWPGLGPLLVEAILARDVYVVIGAVMLSTLFLAVGNLAADIVLYWADPRIRARVRRT